MFIAKGEFSTFNLETFTYAFPAKCLPNCLVLLNKYYPF